MTSEIELAVKRPGEGRWMIQGGAAIIITLISIWLMIDIPSEDLMNFGILMMLSAAAFLYILAAYGLLRERARKKRLERIRARRLATT